MTVIGVNVGALTVKAVVLRCDTRTAVVAPHQGQPLEVLQRIIATPSFADAEFFAVSGTAGHISEVAAIPRAMRETGQEFDAVASPGRVVSRLYPARRPNRQRPVAQQVRGRQR